MRHSPILSLLIAGLLTACTPPKAEDKPTDQLKGYWSYQYNAPSVIIPSVSALAFGNDHLYMALEPFPAGGANLLKIFSTPHKENTGLQKPSIHTGHISEDVIRAISLDEKNKRIAFGGRARQLIILRNDELYLNLNFDDEITQIALLENAVAVGDSHGRLHLRRLPEGSPIAVLPLFDGPIASMRTADSTHVWIGGAGSQIHLVNVSAGKIIRSIETQTPAKAILRKLAIQPCPRPTVNHIEYAPDQKIIFTGHGDDTCIDSRVAAWDAESGRLLHDVSPGGKSVFAMALLPETQILVTVDSGQNLRAFSSSTLDQHWLVPLPGSFVRKLAGNKDFNLLGDGLAMIPAPDGRHVYLAVGSPHKGGAGVLLLEISPSSMKHIAHYMLDLSSIVHFFSK